jgi:hypothetical protein
MAAVEEKMKYAAPWSAIVFRRVNVLATLLA